MMLWLILLGQIKADIKKSFFATFKESQPMTSEECKHDMYCRDLRTHRSLLCLFAKSYSLHLNLNFRNDKARQWVSKTTFSLKSFQKQILLKKPALIGQRKSFAAVSLSINMWRKCHPAELQEVAGTVRVVNVDGARKRV